MSSFWVYLVLVVLLLMFLHGESSAGPLGSDGMDGCVPGGCFTRLGLLLVALIILIMIIQYINSLG